MVALPILGLVTAHVNLLFCLHFLKSNPWWYAKIRMLFFLLFIIRSILPINLAASSGLSTFLDKSSMPSLSTSSLIIDSLSFSNIAVLLFCFVFLFSSSFFDLNNKLLPKSLPVLFKFCANFVQIL